MAAVSAKNKTIMADYTKRPTDLTGYTLMRGVTDFGNLGQYNLYEKGYSLLTVVTRPRFMEKLGETNADIKMLTDNFCQILEYEFRGLEGLSDVTTETQTLTNGISDVNIITKVIEDSAIQISMRFFEKSGCTITKFLEYYLKGIKDTRSGAKLYHGLIHNGIMEPGYENEVFSMLYISTDNTYRYVERAVLLLNAQPNKAETSMYTGDKGTYEFVELSVEFNCFPIVGKQINQAANTLLTWMISKEAGAKRMILDEDEANYTGISQIPTKL